MPDLVLLRHGQSQWNLADRFTGWVDVDLTEAGEQEARQAGELLKARGLFPDEVWSSVQTRAIRTAWLALTALDRCWVPHAKDWRLNERHYGALTGLNKAETRARHGAEQVHIWRRAYDVPPPPIESGSEWDPARDPRYADLPPGSVPQTESLKITLARVEEIFAEKLAPRLNTGRNLLIAAHGNSLRALMKILFSMSDEAIVALEMPTGNPLVIRLDPGLVPQEAAYLDPARATSLP